MMQIVISRPVCCCLLLLVAPILAQPPHDAGTGTSDIDMSPAASSTVETKNPPPKLPDEAATPPSDCECVPSCTGNVTRSECPNGRVMARPDCPCCVVCARQIGEPCDSSLNPCDNDYGLECSKGTCRASHDGVDRDDSRGGPISWSAVDSSLPLPSLPLEANTWGETERERKRPERGKTLLLCMTGPLYGLGGLYEKGDSRLLREEKVSRLDHCFGSHSFPLGSICFPQP
ncbi:unnamed protein product [Darwinula stevensoni]|uniref:IGFBP N-terminal domain-containing protein n=1 Tax=Darwinula stevensoni TaxID=69355 RepID=A0A7R8X5U3_9CRUS|nr:unnamed protein product [Darwinula stevensoni]CAG0885188.1 unnamed protein product [Darwinula stevensoni]